MKEKTAKRPSLKKKPRARKKASRASRSAERPAKTVPPVISPIAARDIEPPANIPYASAMPPLSADGHMLFPPRNVRPSFFIARRTESLRNGIGAVAGFISDHRASFRKSLAVTLILLFLVSGFTYSPNSVEGATYTFTQTSWTGGATANTATHPTNQTNWNEYSAKDASLSAGASLGLTATQSTITQTDDGTTNTGFNLTGKTFSTTELVGSGNNASVKLTSSVVGPPWTTMANAPGTISYGGSLIYPGSGDYVYALRGGNTDTLYRYSISGNSWTSLAVAPSNIGHGGMAVSTGGNYIYVLPGEFTSDFLRYSISGNSWTTMNGFSGSVYDGGKMVYPGSGDYIYAAVYSAASGTFYRYSISGNSWAKMTNPPAPFYEGNALAYPGSGDYIYATQGSNATNFYRYSISGNSWTTMTAVPGAIDYGGTLTYPGSGDYLYATKGLSAATLWRYSISGNSWTTLTNTPVVFDYGAAAERAGNYIYMLAGKATASFIRYEFANDGIWNTLGSAPAAVGDGGALVYPGSGDYAYALRGGISNAFYRYSISGNSWTSMTVVPANVDYGGALVYPGSGDYIYALVGGSSAAFYRYSISGNSWTAMTSAPSVIGYGGSLVYPGSGNYIYATKGNSASNFYQYSISGNSWTSMTSAPNTVRYGGSLAYPGSGDFIYLLRGQDTVNQYTDFYRYSISGNSWTSMTTLSAVVHNGGALVSPGSGDYLYALKGNTTNQMYRYSISGNAWVEMANLPATVYVGGSLAYVSSTGAIYALRGNTTTAFYNMALNSYNPSGTFTSGVMDTGVSDLSWGTLSWSNSGGQTVTMKARSCSDASCTTGTAWASCSNITSGAALSTGSCVTNGQRYIQYQATLSTNNTLQSPSLDDVTVTYNTYPASQTLTSSGYNTADPTNVVGGIAWTENASLPSGTGVTVSLRTAATSGGLSSASWTDFTNATANCSKASGTVTCTAAAIPAGMKDGSGDQWAQYKVTLTSTGANTPTVSGVTLTYVVNAPPEFNAAYGTNGISVSQISDSTDANWGKVVIQYSVRDTDTTSGSNTPGYVTPSFQYNIGGGWQTIGSQYLAANDTANKAVGQSSYTLYSAVWDAKSQIPSAYSASAQIKVTVNDNEAANNTTAATGAAFTVDTTAPTQTAFTGDSTTDTIAINISDNSNLEYRLSNNVDLSADGVNGTSGAWQTPGAASVNTTISPWTFGTTGSYERAYMQVRDIYGNTATSTLIIPGAPANPDIKDISNTSTGEYREFIAWALYAATTSGAFANYKVYRSTDGSSYSLLTTITDINTNYYRDNNLATTTTYYYKVKTTDTDGDVSGYSTAVNDQPNGQTQADTVAPVISSVVATTTQATWARILWTTDELANSVINYGTTSGSYPNTFTSNAYVTSHDVTLSGLAQNTTYYYRVRSSDIANNETVSDNSGAGYTFTTTVGTTISAVTTESVNDNSATIVWNTNTAANSYVVYATSVATLAAGGGTEIGNAAPVSGPPYQHRVTLPSLTSQTTYYYYVKSTDANANTATDKNAGAYYSFTTTYDTKGPVISNISVPIATKDSAIITWATDEPATSQADYGTSAGSYGNTTTLDSTLSVSHAVTLTNLTKITPYYYRVRSKDAANNESVSTEQTFTTADESTVYVGYTRTVKEESQKDVLPPDISNIQIQESGPFAVIVSFDTNEPATGFVSYGRSEQYGSTAASPDFLTHREIKVDGLRMGTTYHFVMRAQDTSANAATSQDLTFTTKFAAEALSDLITLDNAAQFQDSLENIIESILPSLVPPFVSDVLVSNITDNGAVVSWKTNVPSYGILSRASENEYDAARENPYGADVIEGDEKMREHTVVLAGLTPSTLYHVQAKGFVFAGATGKSKDVTFTTRTSKIGASIVRVGNTDAEIVWTTPRETTSFAEYRNLRSGKIGKVGDEIMSAAHRLLIENLDPDTAYEIRPSGTDARGNLVETDPVSIHTKRDAEAPDITGIKIDNALLPGKTDRLQSVVSWKTNEPANSVVYFEEGVGVSEDLANKVGAEKEYVTNHAVIITSFKTATVYRIRISSTDEAGNTALSTIRSILTPRSSESIVDVITKNLQDTFGFLKNVQGN